jgi:cytochrome c oxidase assembly protein subunit 15
MSEWHPISDGREKARTLLIRMSCIAFLVALMVVVLGAYTRLVHAGLGCPDWPTCYGHLWVPDTEQEISIANDHFAATPVDPQKTWPEQIHRILASTLGVLILAIFFVAFKHRTTHHGESLVIFLSLLMVGTVLRVFLGDALDIFLAAAVLVFFLNLARVWRNKYPFALPLTLFALLAGVVILQGLFGMWTVTWKLWPQVVTLHLMGGFSVISLIGLAVLKLIDNQWVLPAAVSAQCLRIRLLSSWVLVLTVVQIFLGGWMSSNYAALACPDFPLCQNSVLPKMDILQGFDVFQRIGPVYLGGLLDGGARTAIHFFHRVGAALVIIFAISLSWRLWRLGETQTKNLARLLSTLLILQVGLGVNNVVLGLPLWNAVAHNACGALLLLLLVFINYRLYTIKTQ